MWNNENPHHWWPDKQVQLWKTVWQSQIKLNMCVCHEPHKNVCICPSKDVCAQQCSRSFIYNSPPWEKKINALQQQNGQMNCGVFIWQNTTEQWNKINDSHTYLCEWLSQSIDTKDLYDVTSMKYNHKQTEVMVTEYRQWLPLRDYKFGDSAGILWLPLFLDLGSGYKGM